jgi:hypothetical protein
MGTTRRLRRRRRRRKSRFYNPFSLHEMIMIPQK